MPRSRPLHVLIDENIVDVIIGEMTFHSEDMGGISWARLLTSFEPTLDSSDEDSDNGVTLYVINVSNRKQFLLVTQCLVAEISFRQVNGVIDNKKELPSVESFRSFSDCFLSRHARFICTVNL